MRWVELGTGKTHEAIGLDMEWNPKAKLPTLIVAPLNTHSSWVGKYAMQWPATDVVTLGRKPKDREEFVRALLKGADCGVMHWEALRLLPELRDIHFELIVADEVHRASNRKAQATRALKKLTTNHKLAMSGTAAGDKPEGLWSILNWLYPRNKEFSSYWRFRRKYCIEETQHRGTASYTQITGVKNIDVLMQHIEPFYVRHLKREQCCEWHPEGVMSWLPEKTYDVVRVTLSPTQRRVYEQMRRVMVAWIGEHEDSPLVASVVVAQMTRLSQMSLATPLLDSEGNVSLSMPSSKIDALKEIVNDHPGKQFVVFTSSKKAAYLAAQSLPSAEVLSGDTPQALRDTIVDRFRNGEFQVFVGVIAACAEGIDGLQFASDTAIFLDRSWSTIKNKQAEDRLHRDGQENAVNIIDIVAEDTLDWGRMQKLEAKWSWIKQVLGDDNYTMQKALV